MPDSRYLLVDKSITVLSESVIGYCQILIKSIHQFLNIKTIILIQYKYIKPVRRLFQQLRNSYIIIVQKNQTKSYKRTSIQLLSHLLNISQRHNTKMKVISKSTKSPKAFSIREQINISPNLRLIIYLFTTTMLLLTLVLNLYWKQSLYWQGLHIINTLQTAMDFTIIKIVNNIFSMFGNPIVVSLLVVIEICIVKHKFKALIHLSFFLLGLYIIAFMKLAYQQSRPIWSWDQIHKWEWFCPKDFGNPSGHSFIIFPLYEPMISKYVGFEKFKCAWFLLVLFGFFVPFSRTYLGMHSVNQVMFGLTLGVGASVLYRFAIRQWFYVTYSRIFKLKKIKYLFAAFAIHMICLLLPFLFFQLSSDNRPLEEKDLLNLNKICSKQGPQDDVTSAYMQQSMLIKCTFESFIFGIIYGLYFINITTMDLTKQKLYFAGRWSYISKRSAFEHISTTILMCGLLIVTFVFVLPKIYQQTFFHYFSYTVGSTLTGFSLIFFMPKIDSLFEWIDYHEEEIPVETTQLAEQLPVPEIPVPEKSAEDNGDVSQFFG